MNNITNNNENTNINQESNVVELYTIQPKNRVLLNILITFAVCFVFVIFTFQVLFIPINIVGPSMQPTINNDYTAINDHQDTVYYFKSNNYKHGDIVIIQNEIVQKPIIKRIIATGGETITFRVYNDEYTEYTPEFVSPKQIWKMSLEISVTDKQGNTRVLNEYYIKEHMVFEFITDINSALNQYEEYVTINDSLKETDLSHSITLPENTFYCLGDNRNNSIDSRCYGYFSSEDILGKMVLHVPYGKSIFYAIWHSIF